MDIRALKREGHSIKRIAVMTGRSRNTVRKALKAAFPQQIITRARSSKLDAFKEYVRERFETYRLSAVRLVEEIRERGYTGSLRTVRRYVASLDAARRRNARKTVRFETPPGKQGQADWAYCGRFPDASGKLVPIYVFVIVLGFSRMMYGRVEVLAGDGETELLEASTGLQFEGDRAHTATSSKALSDAAATGASKRTFQRGTSSCSDWPSVSVHIAAMCC